MMKQEAWDVKPGVHQPRRPGMGAGRGRSPGRGGGVRGGSTGSSNGSDMMLYTQQVIGHGVTPTESTDGSGTKTYKCPKCDKEFSQKSHFFGHMNSHLNVRPYSCDKCGKGFAYSQNLARHQKSCFTPSKHTCTFCNVSCNNAQELQMHLLQAHAGSM